MNKVRKMTENSNAKRADNRIAMFICIGFCTMLGGFWSWAKISTWLENSKYPIKRQVTVEELRERCSQARTADGASSDNYERAKKEALQSSGVDPNSSVTYGNFDKVTKAAQKLSTVESPSNHSDFWCKNAASGSLIEEYLEDGKAYTRVLNKGVNPSIEEQELKASFDQIKTAFPVGAQVVLETGQKGQVTGHKQGNAYGNGKYNTHKVLVKYMQSNFFNEQKMTTEDFSVEELKLSQNSDEKTSKNSKRP